MPETILGLLISLVSPLFLLLIERFLPYPYLIEEVVKLLIVWMMVKAEKRTKENLWFGVFIAGFLFAVSESILYLNNILVLGDFIIFPKRLVLTGGLHTMTMMLMYFLGRKRYAGLAVGFIGAVLIHYFFNLWVARL